MRVGTQTDSGTVENWRMHVLVIEHVRRSLYSLSVALIEGPAHQNSRHIPAAHLDVDSVADFGGAGLNKAHA